MPSTGRSHGTKGRRRVASGVETGSMGPGRRTALTGRYTGGTGNAAISATLSAALEQGLLTGDKSAHLSAHITPALLDAAKRETGIQSTAQLIEYALASVATPDPTARFMTSRFGVLGRDHDLDL